MTFDSVNETAGSLTTSDSETTVLIEFSDSDAEVSEVDASELISAFSSLSFFFLLFLFLSLDASDDTVALSGYF